VTVATSSSPGAPTDRIARAIAAHAGALPWRTSRFGRFAKRALDLALAAPALVVALPVMAGVAALVRASDPAGPVLFRQQRIGLDGELFTMWKFRTMRVETAAGAVAARGEVTRGDPRLIRGGAQLRDWRLDELPQLVHVLSGRMSLVGPRPDLPANLPAYADAQLVRFAMPPGCTAWTFTRGAFANDWATRQAINTEYVRRWTVWLDLQVLFGTVGVLLAQRDTAPAVAEVPGARDSVTRP
jgi:sugar transferase EpsL